MPANPFQYTRPVSPQVFFGHWPLVRKIADDLLHEGGESHAIVAGRSCGKTSLLNALAYQLRQPQTAALGDWRPFVVPFAFKTSALQSAEKCLAEIFNEARRRVDASVRRRPADAWPAAVKLDAPWFQALASAPALSLGDFQDALGYLLDQMGTPLEPVRAILLLDEMDCPLGKEWTDSLFNQLRSLVYFGDLKDAARLVLAGSRRFLDEVSSRGSPLWNVLKFHYLEAFDEASFRELARQAPELSKGVISEVWKESGGQPFLAQFLLCSLLEEKAPAEAAVEDVQRVVAKFIHERTADLEGWAAGMEEAGLRAYQVLAECPDWLPEDDIVRAVKDPQVNTKRGLTALCYHGVVVHDGNWARYRRSGDLFGRWFAESGMAMLERIRKKSSLADNLPSGANVGTVIITDNATVDTGDKIGSVSARGNVVVSQGDSANIEQGKAEK